MKKLLQCLGVISATLFVVTAVMASVEDRVSPVGDVCMAGDPCASAQVVANSGDAGARSGDAIYNKSCVACHASGAAGAPKLGDVAAWAPRIEKGLETLTDNAWNGIAAMPAKGLCMDCSKEEIAETVAYMVENSK